MDKCLAPAEKAKKLSDLIDNALIKIKAELVEHLAEIIGLTAECRGAIVSQTPQSGVEIRAKIKSHEKKWESYEDECMKVLALHQPVAVDLRNTMTLYKIGHDFERVSALLAKIANKLSKLDDNSEQPFTVNFISEIERVENMLKLSKELMVKHDPNTASEIVSGNEEIKTWKKQVRESIEKSIHEQQDESRKYFVLLGILRHFTRIADLLSDIAEDLCAYRSENPNESII